jgi:molybdopterin-binding protein
MKISARNVLSGKVISCVIEKTTACVKIEIASGEIITTSITREAVEDLEIVVGQRVAAIVKSSDVLIGVGAEFEQRRRASQGIEESRRIQSAKLHTSTKAAMPAASRKNAPAVPLNVLRICEQPSKKRPRSSIGRCEF